MFALKKSKKNALLYVRQPCQLLHPHPSRKTETGIPQTALDSKAPTPQTSRATTTEAVVVSLSKNVHCTGGKECDDHKGKSRLYRHESFCCSCKRHRISRT